MDKRAVIWIVVIVVALIIVVMIVSNSRDVGLAPKDKRGGSSNKGVNVLNLQDVVNRDEKKALNLGESLFIVDMDVNSDTSDVNKEFESDLIENEKGGNS